MEKRKSLILFLVSFVFVTLFSRSTSFLYAFEGFDAAIFKQMGLAVLKGKTLYIDYFDNKGCFLYFIQALGLLLGGNFCILLFQVLSLMITLVIWDRIIMFYHQGRLRYFCLGISLLLLLCFYEGGDLSEEWCLPFASYPIYLYFRYLKTNKTIRKIEMFVVGLCLGIIAFIRMNNASVFLGYFLVWYFTLLQRKEYKRFFTDILLLFSGVMLVISLCVLYFYLKAGLYGVEEMVYGTFLSYFEYFGYTPNRRFYVLNVVFYILFLGICVTFLSINSTHQKTVLISTLISYTFFILSSGTRCFTHYLMATMPLFVVCLATMNVEKYRKANLGLAFALMLPIAFYLVRPIGFFVNDLVLNKEPFRTSYANFHHCIEEIPESERDSIYNYNLSGIGAGMMQHEGMLQCNRVLYSPLAFHLPRLHNEETSKPFTKPKWILISGDKTIDENDILFIQDNYELINYFDHNAQYNKGLDIGELVTVCFYRRKN